MVILGFLALAHDSAKNSPLSPSSSQFRPGHSFIVVSQFSSPLSNPLPYGMTSLKRKLPVLWLWLELQVLYDRDSYSLWATVGTLNSESALRCAGTLLSCRGFEPRFQCPDLTDGLKA
ncbi:hypothetical protein PoB_000612500 [Plakobranchus ocellatus]|uniref:Uncharacterized protein n=1 Tax=Plakobranchus ocellatus TaxID=259542 RepID=A0AAV3YA10_9GAST|nr:hypothetical protein PoB_000612500 [Plakobranchus ocellatus]